MATQEGERLTAAYRRGQLAVRARHLREVSAAWRVLDVTALSQTLGVFAQAAARIVLGGWWQSADETVAYLGDFREAEGVPGSVTFVPPAAPSADEVAGLIRGAAATGIINARRSGKNARASLDNGLVKTLGQSALTVLNGGRDTVLLGEHRDPKARRYERDVSGSACYFCLMLKARGAVYRSERSSSFEAHPHCGCTGRLVYAASDQSAELAAEWARVTAGKSGVDARRAWRAHVEGRA